MEFILLRNVTKQFVCLSRELVFRLYREKNKEHSGSNWSSLPSQVMYHIKVGHFLKWSPMPSITLTFFFTTNLEYNDQGCGRKFNLIAIRYRCITLGRTNKNYNASSNSYNQFCHVRDRYVVHSQVKLQTIIYFYFVGCLCGLYCGLYVSMTKTTAP